MASDVDPKALDGEAIKYLGDNNKKVVMQMFDESNDRVMLFEMSIVDNGNGNDNIQLEMEETSAKFLQRVGSDGQKWAQEFMKLFGNKKDKIDESLMLGWFCNAIEAGKLANK